MEKNKLRQLEEAIGYRFQNSSLAKQAMIHSSFTNEHNMDKLSCNERLEFLGDSVWKWCPAIFCTANIPISRRES